MSTVQAATLARASDSADLVLSGIEPNSAFAGAVLCHPDFPVHLASKVEARVLVLDISIPILKGHAVTVHAHAAREAGTISGLVAVLDSKTGQQTKQRPRCLLKGQVGVCVCCASSAVVSASWLLPCGNQAIIMCPPCIKYIAQELHGIICLEHQQAAVVCDYAPHQSPAVAVAHACAT